jgi:hypothetical protein
MRILTNWAYRTRENLMTATASTSVPIRAGRIRYRLLIVGIATLAPVAIWGIATSLGVNLTVASPLTGTVPISAIAVVGTALPMSLLAWGLLALLERLTPSAQRIWTIIAVAVLVLSLVPVALLDATDAAKVSLAVMHIAAGLPLAVLLRRGARNS